MEEGIVRVSDVTYRYPKGEEPALRGVNLEVKRGEVLAIMGPTGAGKTTLVSLFNGLIPHYFEGRVAGEVLVNDLSTFRHRIQDLVEHVGLVLQDPETQIFGITVLEDTAFGPSNLGYPREQILNLVREALAAVRLSGYEERLTANLSGGEKQRLAIAGVLAMQPEILVLDEPTSELDPLGRAEVFEAVSALRAERQATVILVEHETEDVLRLADKVAVIAKGEIVWYGAPRDLFRDVLRTRDLSIRPPEVAELGLKLCERGLLPTDEIPLTLEEAEAVIREMLGGKKLEAQAQTLSSPGTVERTTIIETIDLTHVYPGGIQAVSGVNLKIRKGEFIALVGQNGAGKTTLVKHFNGLLTPTSGAVMVNGVDTRELGIGELAKQVGYVFQNPDHQIFSTTVEEEIRYGLKNLGLSEDEQEMRIREALSLVGLEDKRGRHPFTLSKGERQKVAVASILAIAPPVIIIDEPTTGLDWTGTTRMLELISALHRRGHTVIMITHNMRIVANYAERVIVMSEGKILLDGSPSQVFEHAQELQRSYLEPPQMTLLAQRLADLGCPKGIVTVDQMVEVIANALR